jgi:hypothetical protein
LPVAEGFGTPRLNPIFLSFLGATLAVAVLNYLPTPLAPTVLCLAAGCGLEMMGLAKGEAYDGPLLTAGGHCLVGLSSWLALAALALRKPAATEFDETWLRFRNRYGVVWGQRTREQFNRAAANAGWPLTLAWHGLQAAARGTPPDPALPLETLRALLKRFDYQ